MDKLETFSLDACTHFRHIIAQKRTLFREVTRYFLDVSENAPDPEKNECDDNTKHNNHECGYDEEDIHFQEVIHRYSIVPENAPGARLLHFDTLKCPPFLGHLIHEATRLCIYLGPAFIAPAQYLSALLDSPFAAMTFWTVLCHT